MTTGHGDAQEPRQGTNGLSHDERIELAARAAARAFASSGSTHPFRLTPVEERELDEEIRQIMRDD